MATVEATSASTLTPPTTTTTTTAAATTPTPALALAPASNAITNNGQWVVLKTEKLSKLARAKNGIIIMAGNLKFKMDRACGCPFGSKFTVENNHLVRSYFHKTETAAAFAQKISTDKSVQDNRNLDSADGNQVLSHTDIQALKEQGTSGKEIIGQVIKNSKSFQQKTVFSQEKYVKAKTKKYSNTVIIMQPTTRLLADLYYTRAPETICNLRPDSLAIMLARSNVRTGSRVLCVDNCRGLLTGAVMDRVGATGKVIQVHAGDRRVTAVVDNYNFTPHVMDTLLGYPLYGMDHLLHPKDLAEKVDSEKEENAETDDDTRPKREYTEKEQTDFAVVLEQRKQRKQKRRADLLQSHTLLQSRKMDAVLMVCRSNPLPLLKATMPLLAPSRQFVIFFQYKEPLLQCYVYAKSQGAIQLDLSERWTQEYQVLPDRTHPHMMMDGSSGYVLSGTTTYQPPSSVRTTTTTTTTTSPTTTTTTAAPDLKRKLETPSTESVDPGGFENTETEENKSKKSRTEE